MAISENIIAQACTKAGYAGPLTNAEASLIIGILDDKPDALAWAKWKREGGPRPERRADGWTTRSDMAWMTPAERAIYDVVGVVERAGASLALTDAVIALGHARNRVADHVEGKS